MRLRLIPAILVFIGAAAGFGGAVALAGPRTVIICNPGGMAADPNVLGKLSSLYAELENLAGWPKGSLVGKYTEDAAEALKWFAAEKPGFLLISPGLFAEWDRQRPIEPLLRARRKGTEQNRYYVVTRVNGGAASLEELAGKTLGGDKIAEVLPIWAYVFGPDWPRTAVKLAPSPRPLRALRDAAAGTLDAVLLDEVQWQSLAAFPAKDQLRAIYKSPESPHGGFMAVKDYAAPVDAKALAAALQKLCTNETSAHVCKTMGVDGFVPTSRADYEAVLKARAPAP